MRALVLLVLLVSGVVSAEDKMLKVAVNIGPPWAYFEEEQGVIGIDVDIINHALGKMGYGAEFHLLAYNRVIKEFNEGKFDIASPAAFPAEEGAFTQPYLPYKDVAVSLKDKKLTINSVSDLSDKRVVAYQFAHTVLGERFAGAVNSEGYLEIAEREVQLTLLVNNKTDVVVGEKRLLEYIMRAHYGQISLTVHPIFEQKSYGAVFKEKALQQKFDAALRQMKQDGSYQAILARWP